MGIQIEWQGKGLMEKGIDPSTGKILSRNLLPIFPPRRSRFVDRRCYQSQKGAGWIPKTSLKQLVQMMIQADLEEVGSSQTALRCAIMKTALVYDWFAEISGGGEKAFEAVYNLFPSPIYTLLQDPNSLKGRSYEREKIHSSFIQHFPRALKYYRIIFHFIHLQLKNSIYQITT